MATPESTSSSKVLTLTKELFTTFYDKLQGSELSSVHDLYIRYNARHGDVSLSTEDDTLSVQTTIYDWIVEQGDSVDKREEVVIKTLKEILAELQEEGFFEDLAFQRPLSILFIRDTGNDDDDNESTVDSDNTEPIEEEHEKEIYFIDDDWVRLDDPLMKGLDSELDAFFDQLMQDSE